MRLLHFLTNALGFFKVGKVTMLEEYPERISHDELKMIFSNGNYEWFMKHLAI